MEYYVYAYLDTTQKINKEICGYFFEFRPIYIGKGKNKRDISHLYNRNFYNYLFYKKLNKMIESGNNPLIIRISTFEIEADAYEHEERLIKEIKNIKNNGYLYNLTEGGFGVSGYKHTQKTKKALSKKLKGKELSKEHCEKISQALKNKKKPMGFGEKISKIKKGSKMSEESRKKISNARKGKSPWNKGNMKDVILQLDFENNILKEWTSLDDLKSEGFQIPNILNCCNGSRKSHKGFIWKYKSNNLID